MEKQQDNGSSFSMPAIQLLVMSIVASVRDVQIPIGIFQEVSKAYGVHSNSLFRVVSFLEHNGGIAVCMRQGTEFMPEPERVIESIRRWDNFESILATFGQAAFFDTTPGTPGSLFQAYHQHVGAGRFAAIGIEPNYARDSLSAMANATVPGRQGYAGMGYAGMPYGQRPFGAQQGFAGQRPGLFTMPDTRAPRGSEVKKYEAVPDTPVVETLTKIKGVELDHADLRLMEHKFMSIYSRLAELPGLCDDDFAVTVEFKGMTFSLTEVRMIVNALS